MVLNMDTELQRLICVSVEKMTRDVNGRGLPGHGSRKSRGLDLRKALLVAHVLQDMRSAYISDDYQVLVNTVCPDLKISSELEMEKLRRKLLTKEYDEYSEEVTSSRKRFISDDWSTGSVERPPRSEGDDTSFMTAQYLCPAGSQDCAFTCSDATMSKISQITHPVPVSINTTYVLSHQACEKDDRDTCDETMDCDETPAVCEQVEVTSSNDVESEQVETEIVQCEELDNAVSSPEMITKTLNESISEITTVTKQSDKTNSQGSNRSSVSCPLPRKKRPLPKEFLEPEVETEMDSKRTKVDDVVTSAASDAIVTTSGCYLSTTTATTLTQSMTFSSSSLSQCATTQTSPCATVTSSVCTTLVSSSASGSIVTASNSQEGPKVVVEMNKQPSLHNIWSWTLPATCTQPKLSRWLMDGVYRSQMSELTKLRESSIHNAGLPGLVAY